MSTFRCTAHGVFSSGQTWDFRMHFTSGSSVGTLQADWHTALNAAWTGGAHPLDVFFPVATVLNLSKTELLTLTHVVGPPAVDKMFSSLVDTNAETLPGTSANDGLPENNVILVPLKTGIPGPHNRGRIHLPAPDKTLVTAGKLDATHAGYISTAINGVITSMGAAGHAACLLTYTLSKRGIVPGTTVAITVAETDKVIRTLRGRTRGLAGDYA